MLKQDFLDKLRWELSGLPKNELEERLSFYSEMIDDRMEEGVSEEEAVAAVGTIDEIVYQILTETPLSAIAKEKARSKRQMKTWEIVLLAVGAPIWLSLLISAFAVVLSLYVSWWAAVISLWAVFVSVAGCAVGAFLSGIGMAVGGFTATGIAVIGSGFICTGIAIFLFFGCKAVTDGAVTLTKKCVLGMKKRLARKEEA